MLDIYLWLDWLYYKIFPHCAICNKIRYNKKTFDFSFVCKKCYKEILEEAEKMRKIIDKEEK